MLTDGRTDGWTDGRTDDGRKVITIAHPEQSSGELKNILSINLLLKSSNCLRICLKQGKKKCVVQYYKRALMPFVKLQKTLISLHIYAD